MGSKAPAQQFSIIFAVLLVVGTLSWALAALPEGENKPSVDLKLAYLVDSEGNLDANSVVHNIVPFKEEIGRPANWGPPPNPNSVFWLRVKIGQLPEARMNWVIAQADRRIIHAELYVVNALGRPVAQRTWPEVDATFMAPFPAFLLARSELDGYTLYLRVRTVGAMRDALILQPSGVFLASYERSIFLSYGLAVLLLLLAAYCAIVGSAVGERTLLLLAATLLAIFVYVAGDRALLQVWLPQGAGKLSRLMAVTGGLAIGPLGLLFSMSFLQIAVRRLWAITVVFVAIVLLPIGIWHVVSNAPLPTPLYWPGALASLLAIALGILKLGQREWRGGLFLLCWSPAIAGGLIRMSLNMFPEAIPVHALSVNAAYLGNALSGVLFAIVLSLDVRDRLLQAALERVTSERRFRDFAQVASDNFWETDAAHRITQYILGEAGGLELRVGLSLLEQFEGRGADVWRLRFAFFDALPFRDCRLRFIDGNGRERHLSLSGRPIIGPEGDAQGWRGTLTDVSSSIAEEWAMGRQRTFMALGFFASSVAHDVNNLLHPILNIARRLGQTMQPDDTRKRQVEIIDQSARKAGEIVSSILSIAREPRSTGVVPLGAAVADSMRLIESVNTHSVLIEARIEHSGGPLVDETEVFRVLANLVTNAAASTQNAGTVSVRYGVHAAGGFVLEVGDTGSGMPDDIRRFTEGARRSKPGVDAGLGLMIVRQLVGSLGGRIEVRGQATGGTVVAIVFDPK